MHKQKNVGASFHFENFLQDITNSSTSWPSGVLIVIFEDGYLRGTSRWIPVAFPIQCFHLPKLTGCWFLLYILYMDIIVISNIKSNSVQESPKFPQKLELFSQLNISWRECQEKVFEKPSKHKTRILPSCLKVIHDILISNSLTFSWPALALRFKMVQ